MNSLIPPTDVWLLWAIIVSGVAASIYLEQTRTWAARISGPVLALVIAMVFSNTGLVPVNAPAYDVVDDYLVPLAIPLLLFQANLKRILGETGSMFRAFHVAALGTLIGSVLAAVLFRGSVEKLNDLIAVMTGSYIGGSVNFVALKESLNVPDTLSNPLIVADNFVMAGMFAALLVIAGSRWFLARFPHPHTLASDAKGAESLAAEHWRRKEISLLDIAKALAVAFIVVALSKKCSGWVNSHTQIALVKSLAGNLYVWITAFTVTLSTLAPRLISRIHGADEVGMYLLYLFFFVIGLRADLVEVVRKVPVLFGVCGIMAVTNLAVTLVLGKLFRLNLEELLLSVNATLGGAPSAAAMAIAKGWRELVLPGLLVGIWGYVIGTFCGVLVSELLRRLF